MAKQVKKPKAVDENAPSPTQDEEKKKVWPKVRDGAIATIATLAVTGVVGDFIIKRNLVAYNAEVTTFENSDTDAEESFKNHQAFYNRLLAERRGASQKMANIIADNNLPGIHAYYDEYYKTVEDWNSGLRDMGQTLLNASRCNDERWKNEDELREATFSPIYSSVAERHNFFLSIAGQKAEKAKKDVLEASRFCPTHFLTKSNSDYSVHTVFREMHLKISALQKHPYSQCIANHRNNISQYYQSCSNWNNTEEITQCMRNADEMVYSGALCKHIQFNLDDFKIREKEFVELDFYWDLGNTFFKSFKYDFMVRYCENRKRFWGEFLNWDCKAKIGKT